MKKIAFDKAVCFSLVVAVASSFIGGCAGENGGDPSVGNIGFALSLPGSATVNEITYTLTGPNGYSKTDTFTVAGPGKAFTYTLPGIPAGNGYQILLSATSTDGRGCNGKSMTFTVVAGQSVSVAVVLSCGGKGTTGTVILNGNLNICPVADSAIANPMSAAVGGTIGLNGSGSDEDNGPSALTYAWAATGNVGTIANASSANATFTCIGSGNSTVTLTVKDGDTQCTGNTLSVDVSCSGSETAGASGTAGTGASAGTGAGGVSGGAGGASGSSAGAGAGGASGSSAGAGGASGSSAGAGGISAGAGGASGSSAGAGGISAGAGGASGSSAGAGGISAGAGGTGGSGSVNACNRPVPTSGSGLIQNGGFETPVVTSGSFQLFATGETFASWTVFGATGTVAPLSKNYTAAGLTWPAHGGNQTLDLTGLSNTATGVSQQVATVAGTSYALSFWVGNLTADAVGGNTSTVEVQVNNTAVLTAVNSGGAGTTTLNYKKFCVSFVATSASTTIGFLNRDSSTDTSNILDDVSLF